MSATAGGRALLLNLFLVLNLLIGLPCCVAATFPRSARCRAPQGINALALGNSVSLRFPGRRAPASGFALRNGVSQTPAFPNRVWGRGGNFFSRNALRQLRPGATLPFFKADQFRKPRLASQSDPLLKPRADFLRGVGVGVDEEPDSGFPRQVQKFQAGITFARRFSQSRGEQVKGFSTRTSISR